VFRADKKEKKTKPKSRGITELFWDLREIKKLKIGRISKAPIGRQFQYNKS